MADTATVEHAMSYAAPAVTELVEAILDRAAAPGGIDAFELQSEKAYHCAHPVRLY